MFNDHDEITEYMRQASNSFYCILACLTLPIIIFGLAVWVMG